MKIKILSLPVILLCFNIFINAQVPDSVVNKNVTVTRKFQPTIIETSKIQTTPQLVKADIKKSKPDYSEISIPLNISYNIHKLVAKELIHPQPEFYKGFARFGLGNPLNTLADFKYPILSDGHNRLDVNFNHLGAFGDKKHSKTALNFNFDRLFEANTLYAEIGGTHDFFNYYGKSFNSLNKQIIPSDLSYDYGSEIYENTLGNKLSLDKLAGMPLDNTNWRFNGKLGLRSLPLTDNVRYDVTIQYHHFNSVQDKLAENQLGVLGKIEVPKNHSRFGINLGFYLIGYQDELSLLSFSKNYNVFKLNPYYLLERDLLTLRLGAKTGLSVGEGKVFTPSPDIALEFRILPDYLALYGGVTGDLTINSLDRIYDENRWVTSETRLEDTYTPLDAYAGIKLSPTYNLMIDVFGQYKMISNQYFYVNRTYSSIPVSYIPSELNEISHNRFDVVYSEAKKTSIGMRFSWDYKNFGSIYGRGVYNYWIVDKEAYAWQLPKWEADFGASIKILNDISINTQFLFQDGRYAMLTNGNAVPMLSVIDLNFGASYAYRGWLSVFAKVDNVLNRKYDIYYGYEVQGINLMLGAAFSF